MKRLLVIGASILQLPGIRKAKEMGLAVAVADYNPNAVGIPYADEYYNVSTIDAEGIYRAAKEFGADGIMTLATDMPMRSLAYACEKLGLVGISYDTAVKATDKGEMIKTFEANGVAHPFYRIASKGKLENAAELPFPLITKPTDNSGSRGVMLVRNEEELKNALAYSSENGRGGDVIVEEYMRGPEVSVEVMVSHGVAHVLQITDKLTTGAPHFVEMGHSQPSRLSPDTQEKIRDLASRAALSVGIENGPAHVEIIVTEDGPKMVELGARMGGDCITTHLVPLSTGIDMVGNTIKIALGEEPDLERKFSKGAAIRYFDVPCGTITAIEGVEETRKIPGVAEISFVKTVGDSVGEVGSSTDRVGFVIAQAETPEEAVKVCEAVLERVRIKSMSSSFSKKKLLVLGGSMATYAIVENAKALGAITYVADMQTTGEAYQNADIGVNISTTDIDALADFVKSEGIDGVFCGPSEFNIQNAMKLAEVTGLRFYTNRNLWNKCGNKKILKQFCGRNGLPLIPEFVLRNENDIDSIPKDAFPVIVKPVDGCSSKGVTVCKTAEELRKAYSDAIAFSQSGSVIVEKYIDNGGQLFSFRYVLDGDKCYPYFLMDTYIADPVSKKCLVSAFTISPSKFSHLYFEDMNEKVKKMIQDMGLRHGVCFAQSLPYEGNFYVHDMGYRLSGGMIYKMTDALYGINDMKMMIRFALGGSIITEEEKQSIDLLANNKYVGQLMIPLNEGKINSIKGFEEINNIPEVIQFIQYYHEGDTIASSVIGTLGQHLARISFCTETREQMLKLVEKVQNRISVLDEHGKELYTMRFDVDRAR